MISALIVVCYLAVLMVNIAAIRNIDIWKFNFIDGLLLGLTYYITIPMAFILLYGRIGSDFLHIEDYLPYEDVNTTFLIYFAAMLVCGLKIYLPALALQQRLSFRARRLDDKLVIHENALRPNQRNRRTFRLDYVHWLLAINLAIYYASTLFVFFKTGVSDGEHWYHATSSLLAESPIYIIIKYFSNFTRTVLFGILGILTLKNPRLRFRLAVVGLVICMSDLFMTFNRVTVIYLGILLLIGSWNKIHHILFGFFVLLFGGVYVGSLWPEFRGQVSNYGYSLSGFADALAKAIEVNSRSLPFVDAINGLFESFTFTVLNWEVKHYSNINVDFGAYFTRPLGAFIPRALWPDRPESFALLLGRNFSRSELALNSYIIGEPFANSWLMWPLLLIIAIVANDQVYRQLSVRDPVWGFVGGMIGFAWWRFDTSFLSVSLFISLILYGAMHMLVGKARLVARSRSRAVRPHYRLPTSGLHSPPRARPGGRGRQHISAK